jgi:hypothetical protein
VEERKEHSGNIYDEQEFFLSLIRPDIYEEKVASRPNRDLAEGEVNITPDDFSMVDQWLKELEKPKTTNLRG